MKLLARTKLEFDRHLDTTCSPEQSIVLRYRNACGFGGTDKEDADHKAWLLKTSMREGAGILPLLVYRGVNICVLDETSFMHTRTLKSIDGCVTIANCKSGGYDKVIFESGGNTGTALTEYGQRAGLETFFFIPEANVSLLVSKTFSSDKAHLIAVEEPRLVKKAAHLFGTLNGIKHIPRADWRHQASMFRGFFVLEYLIRSGSFDWLAQTMSAAFGPIGIYGVLNEFREEIGALPKFLGIQQEANCPMYKIWKANKTKVEVEEANSPEHLLSRVMYDVEPQTYGTYEDLERCLIDTRGDLTTVNHTEFAGFLERQFDGKGILQLLGDNGIEITTNNEEVVEKTGLIALAGTLKEIDKGSITKGSKVLCCLTSGISEADGKAEPEYRIARSHSLEQAIKEYSRIVFGC